MGETKPSVPAELRRRVLVEAGHRCAIPTCRHIEVDVHHIVPYEKRREHEYENLIALCPNCHRRATRGKIDRKSLRMYKANLRYAMEKYSQFEMDTLFELAKLPGGQGLPFPDYLVLLVKRLLDSEFVDFTAPQGGVKSFGISLTPGVLVISRKGRSFVDALGSSNSGY